MRRPAGRLDPRRRDRLLDLAQRAPRDLRQPPGRLPPRVVGRGRAARRGDGRRSARASSRRPTAACSRPTPTSASARRSTRHRDAGRRRPRCRSRSASSRPRRPGDLLDFLDEAAAAGGRIIAQTHCRGISVLLSFQTRLPVRPAARVERAPRPGPVAEQLARARAIPTVAGAVRRRRGATPTTRRGAGVGAQARPPDFEGIRVYEQGLPPNPSVADVARGAGRPPGRGDDRPLRSSPTSSSCSSSRASTRRTRRCCSRALRHPRTVMTFSDSGAHLSQIADSSIHTHLLGHWVRDRQEFTLEEAVRMITLAPALAWGFTDRGLRARGDGGRPQRVRPGDRRPGGARAGRRPARPAAAASSSARSASSPPSSTAQVTIDDGEPTGATPGRLVAPLADRLERTLAGASRGRQRIQRVRGDAAADDPAAVVRGRRRRGSGCRG